MQGEYRGWRERRDEADFRSLSIDAIHLVGKHADSHGGQTMLMERHSVSERGIE